MLIRVCVRTDITVGQIDRPVSGEDRDGETKMIAEFGNNGNNKRGVGDDSGELGLANIWRT